MAELSSLQVGCDVQRTDQNALYFTSKLNKLVPNMRICARFSTHGRAAQNVHTVYHLLSMGIVHTMRACGEHAFMHGGKRTACIFPCASQQIRATCKLWLLINGHCMCICTLCEWALKTRDPLLCYVV